MSQILVQQQRTLKASSLLRSAIGRYTPMKEWYTNRKNSRCAIGAIMSELGWDGKSDRYYYHNMLNKTVRNTDDLVDVIRMNDNGYPWDIIADVLEKKGL